MSCARRTNLKYDPEHDKSNVAHVCVPRRFRSACASAQSDQSLRVICTTSSQGDFVCFPAWSDRNKLPERERERERERETITRANKWGMWNKSFILFWASLKVIGSVVSLALCCVRTSDIGSRWWSNFVQGRLGRQTNVYGMRAYFFFHVNKWWLNLIATAMVRTFRSAENYSNKGWLDTVGKPRTQHIMNLENFISSEIFRVYLTRKARHIIPF